MARSITNVNDKRIQQRYRSHLNEKLCAKIVHSTKIETTQIYIHLSGRETAEPVRVHMQELDRRLERLLKEEETHE